MKTVCIYHSIDLDGWMSAAIVKHWFIKNNSRYTIKDLDSRYEEGKLTAGNDELYFLGYNYGQPIPDLSEYDKVIMADISFSKDEMEKLFDRLNSNFIWIDHHKSAINMMFIEGDRSIHPLGLQQTDYAACELTWMYFFPNESIPEIVRLLGRYDCFGHKGTNEETKVLEFQYGARQCISNYEEAYDYLIESINHIPYEPRIEESIQNSGKAIYRYLCTEAKQTYKNGFSIVLIDESTNFGDNITPLYSEYKFIFINKERFNPINFGIDYHKDGYDGCACFWYANGMWNFSLYNDNGLVDCSAIAKKYGGGGHKGASGFKVVNLSLIFT